MATLNIVPLGSMVKIEYEGQSFKYDPQSQTKIALLPTGGGNVSVQINGVPYEVGPITNIQFSGTPVVNQADFDAKVAASFPKTNSGSGGSGTLSLDDVSQGTNQKWLTPEQLQWIIDSMNVNNPDNI